MFYIPKVIKTVAKSNQWKCDMCQNSCITVTTLQAKHEVTYHNIFKILFSHPCLYYFICLWNKCMQIC